MRPTAHDHVRVYQVLRSAHLERAHAQTPATFLFARRRYDFDPSLAAGLDLVGGSLPARALTVLRSRIRVLEVNEPLQRDGLATTALLVALARLRAFLTRRQLDVVTYAIENRYPFDRVPGASWKSRLRRTGERRLSCFVAGRIDRIAYGTEAAAELYARTRGRQLRGAQSRIVPALPAPCDCPAEPREAELVLFVGALAARKGVDRLLAAWPAVHAARPAGRLAVIGIGPLEPLVRTAADTDPSVDLTVDPPRADIHRALRRARVLVLLSQPTADWREQVGLPIVEGLGHGATVVTTTETGLASWLAAHGHVVLAPDASTDAVAAAIEQALAADRPAASVLADLPAVDGRLAADEWLHR